MQREQIAYFPDLTKHILFSDGCVGKIPLIPEAFQCLGCKRILPHAKSRTRKKVRGAWVWYISNRCPDCRRSTSSARATKKVERAARSEAHAARVVLRNEPAYPWYQLAVRAKALANHNARKERALLDAARGDDARSVHTRRMHLYEAQAVAYAACQERLWERVVQREPAPPYGAPSHKKLPLLLTDRERASIQTYRIRKANKIPTD